MQNYDSNGQMMLFSLDEPDDVDDIFESQPKQKSKAVSLSVLISIPYFHLDLSRGHVDLFGCHYWELRSPWRENGPPLNTGPAPREPVKCALSDILETSPRRKYYLSRTACLGILRRAEERGKELPAQLKAALMAQAGLILRPGQPYHTATEPVGFDGYNGDITDQVSATLGTNCGMSTGRNGVIAPTAFAANQREKVNCRKAAREAALGREVRDIHDVAGALGAQPGMKQQAFIAENCLNPWDTQQARVFTPEGKAPTLAGADGGGGRIPGGLLFAAGVVTKGNGECYLSPERHTSISGGGGMPGQGYPCVLTAGFCAGAAPTAGGIGYQEEIAPTLKAAESGTNMVPSVLCLNDQGGAAMGCSKDVSGTLRAQEHGHQPLVYENHGVDARYTGPHPISPTLSARAGTGGNNLPLVTDAPCFCITGNAIDRQPQNGGNGIGYQENIAYIYSTLHDGLQMPNEEILARGYLTVEAMLAAGAVIALPENSDISLRDILQYELAEDLSLVHTQGGEPIFLEQEEELTRAERKRFSDVLDARVLETRAGEDGTEIVIDGVKPERLEQFRSVLDAYKPEAQSMKFIQ